MKKMQKDDTIITTEVQEGSIKLWLLGKTPLVLNRLSEKAKHELLMPKGKKSAADKASNLKHNPLAEFRSAPHTMKDDNAATYLALPAATPKRALASAAVDMPGGAKKAQIGRLAWVPGEYLPVYGTPMVYMAAVRSADMNHTPDIRTRAIVPQWAVPLTISFVRPIINPTVIVNLLSAAGFYVGVGDGRPEKGALTFGQFTVLAQPDAAIEELLKQDRKVQLAAMANPEAYDDETRELLTWFDLELKVRGKSVAA